MILFTGDSFTWGQGLEWDYLLNLPNWTVDDINKLIPPNYPCEQLPLECNDYRQKNHWPRKVAEYFNYGYDLFRQGNGGSNFDSYKAIEDLDHRIYSENVKLIVVQFTCSSRNPQNTFEESITGDLFKDDILEFKRVITPVINNFPWIKVVTLSWLPEMAILAEKYFGEEYVVKHPEWDNECGFEKWSTKHNLSQNYPGLMDNHFNQYAHNTVAQTVIDHIEKYNLLEVNKFNNTPTLVSSNDYLKSLER